MKHDNSTNFSNNIESESWWEQCLLCWAKSTAQHSQQLQGFYRWIFDWVPSGGDES